MWKDPIVEDVRKARRKLARTFNNDIKKIIAAARKRQKSSGHKVVSFTLKQK